MSTMCNRCSASIIAGMPDNLCNPCALWKQEHGVDFSKEDAPPRPQKETKGIEHIAINNVHGVKCKFCKKVFNVGDAYFISNDGREFWHVMCQVDKVKQ